jgi:hypothetical protein
VRHFFFVEVLSGHWLEETKKELENLARIAEAETSL